MVPVLNRLSGWASSRKTYWRFFTKEMRDLPLWSWCEKPRKKVKLTELPEV